MARRDWKRAQPASLRHAMELCIEHARERRNLSVDRIADLMGLPSKWAIYKWMDSCRLPALLIRPFETACGADYVTRYLAHSAHKLVIDIPSGRRATTQDLNELQAGFSEVITLLLSFYQHERDVESAIGALTHLMEGLAWHRGNVERHRQPELEFGGAP